MLSHAVETDGPASISAIHIYYMKILIFETEGSYSSQRSRIAAIPWPTPTHIAAMA